MNRFWCVLGGTKMFIGRNEDDRTPECGSVHIFEEAYAVVQMQGQDQLGNLHLQFTPSPLVWLKTGEKLHVMVDAFWELEEKEYDSALTSVRASKAGLTLARGGN